MSNNVTGPTNGSLTETLDKITLPVLVTKNPYSNVSPTLISPEPSASMNPVKVLSRSIAGSGTNGSKTSVGSVSVLLPGVGSSDIVVTVTVLMRSSPVGLSVGASLLTVTVTVYSTESPGAKAPTFH